jgi:hypothetical protein
MGMVTRWLFLQAADEGLLDQFTKEGLLGLYSAVVGVAVAQPQLCLGDGAKPNDIFARELFSKLMTVRPHLSIVKWVSAGSPPFPL